MRKSFLVLFEQLRNIMEYLGIDHIVLTVYSIQRSIEFYCAVLGMEEIAFGKGRKAIRCGNQKLNLHEVGKEIEPKALRPLPGSADICVIATTPLKEVLKRLSLHQVHVLEGPVERTGAKGKILSIYFRDPDQNLLEISNQLQS